MVDIWNGLQSVKLAPRLKKVPISHFELLPKWKF